MPSKKADAKPLDLREKTFKFLFSIEFIISKVQSFELSSTTTTSTFSIVENILLIDSLIIVASLYVDKIIEIFLSIVFF